MLRLRLNFSTAWCTVRLISVEKDWNRVLTQKVVTLNTCCDIACLTFQLPHITTGSFQSHRRQPTTGSLQSLQRLKERNKPFWTFFWDTGYIHRVYMYVWYWYTHPKTVTHPSTNHAQHSVTSFIHHYATPSTITSSTLGINKKIDMDFKLYSENSVKITQAIQNYYYYYTHLTASFPARSIKQSAPCSRQVTTLTPHHSIFAGPDALPGTQPTVSSTEVINGSKRQI